MENNHEDSKFKGKYRMKKIKSICMILIIAVSIMTTAGCGNHSTETNKENTQESTNKKTEIVKLSKNQRKFAKERGFDPTNLPKPTVVDTESHDGIDISFHSQFGILDTSGAICFTSQYMDSEDGIDQIEARYYFHWQVLDELAVRDVNYLDVVTIGDKNYLYAPGLNKEAHLYYPVDDGHFMDILVNCVNHWDKDAAPASSVKSLRELMEEDNFASMILFDISGAGVLSKDVNSYGEDYSQDDELEFYNKETTDDDIATEDGITYVKNQLLLTVKVGTDRSLVEALGSEYGFEIVGYLSISDDYQLEFSEDRSFQELENLRKEFEMLYWVRNCYFNYVIETGIY